MKIAINKEHYSSFIILKKEINLNTIDVDKEKLKKLLEKEKREREEREIAIRNTRIFSNDDYEYGGGH